MLNQHYDIAVLGLGVIGASVAHACAKAGLSVVGFDQFHPPHDQGSSHGETRLLRTAYMEGDIYVPLIRQARDLWRELEVNTGTTLFDQTGVIYTGPAGSQLIDGVDRAARTFDIPLAIPQAEDYLTECPGLVIPNDWKVRIEPDAGFVYCEEAVIALHRAAIISGAQFHLGCVPTINTRQNGKYQLENAGAVIEVDRLVLCLGPWLPSFLSMQMPTLWCPPLTLQRRVLHWFTAADTHRAVSGFKPFSFDFGARGWFYGFPSLDGSSIKVSNHHQGTDLDDITGHDRTIVDADIVDIEHHARTCLSGVGARLASKSCLYTTSPDENFIIGSHPDDARLMIVSGMSGHGFKFAPAIGDMVARAILGDDVAIPDPFRIGRFVKA